MSTFKDMFDLSGRKALITGSSRGIGRSIAIALAEFGADVAINYVGAEDKARSAADACAAHGVNTTIVQGDLGDGDAVERVYHESVEALGPLDILVHNTSIQIQEDWLDVSRENFDRQMATNLWSGFRLMQLAAPGMCDRGWGRIVNIGSVQQVKPHKRMVPYAASKCALLSVVKNLAKQLGEFGVTVNNVAPGVINTDRNAEALQRLQYSKELHQSIPLRRWGSPDECAPTVVMLCSEAGAYITGADLYVDGGMGA